jgi:hypothetical protein
MTPEQDLERRLRGWLADGPSVAPRPVVDEALQRVLIRPRRRPLVVRLARRLGLPYALSDRTLRAGAGAMLLVAVTIPLAVLVLSLPTVEVRQPLPSLAPQTLLYAGGTLEGTAIAADGGSTSGRADLRMDDPRVGGELRWSRRLEEAPGEDLARWTAVLRIDNAGGAWEGETTGVRFPDDSELELGWLQGQGGYEGFSMFIDIRATKGSDRAVVGVIWPGPPAPLPEPTGALP